MFTYRMYEIAASLVGIIVVGVSVFLYLENLHRDMQTLQRDLRTSMQAVIAKVATSYEDEKERDAGWLEKEVDEHQRALDAIEKLHRQMEQGQNEMVRHFGTANDDAAFRAGFHEGIHETLQALLGQLESHLRACTE